MNVQVFLLPDLGEGLIEAELVQWLVQVGDTVHIDQPIAEMETAKSVVEVPSPFEGIVETLHGAEGDTLSVGKPLISVAATTVAATRAAESVEPPPAAAQEPRDAGSGSVLIGYGTTGNGEPGRTRPALAQQRAPLVISPLVRKLAHDHGLALADIHGSGVDGLILRSDVEAAMDPQREAGDAVVDQRTGLPVVARTPLTGLQKTAAAAFTRSRKEIPEATVWVDVDATALMELRQEIKERDGRTPGVLAFIARFAVAGLARFPALNMQFSQGPEQQELLEFSGVNLGIAAQMDRGLMVPVIRNVQGNSARELDERIRALAQEVRDGKAAPQTLSGGTFTINNYGVFGVDGSAAIINFPETAMLGIGRIMDKPWVVGGELCVRQLTELTLAFDHRVCDGAVAAAFLRFVADAMENPAVMLAEM